MDGLIPINKNCVTNVYTSSGGSGFAGGGSGESESEGESSALGLDG